LGSRKEDGTRDTEFFLMGWNQPEDEPDRVVMDIDEQELEIRPEPRYWDTVLKIPL
jgi:hypothetical protein